MNDLESVIIRAQNEAISKTVSKETLTACLDLTRLGLDDTVQDIDELCEKALKHKVAAVCVYPKFVAQAKQKLAASNIAIATVANFPSGKDSLPDVLSTIDAAVSDGATELDVVIPYERYISSNDSYALKFFVLDCRKRLPTQKLKVILESGVFPSTFNLASASLACLEGGADFLKTSTGKVSVGATLLSAAVMLKAIVDFADPNRGFKVSGGVKTPMQAKTYYLLAAILLGEDKINKSIFRIGASSLLDELYPLG